MAGTLDGTSNKVLAYALATYGNSTDRDTTAALSLLAHTEADQGTATVPADTRRAQFMEAYNEAPASVRNVYDTMKREGEAYQAPSDASLATEVSTSGSITTNDLVTHVNVPDGHRTVVSLSGHLRFEDGSQSKVVESDQDVKLIGDPPDQGDTFDGGITVDPEQDAVTYAPSSIQTYRKAGVNAQGRESTR